MELSRVMILGGNPNETVNISLIQVGGSSADLIGAAITIIDDDSGDTLFTGTWNGNTITTEIEVNTNYTVSVETITGYTHPSSVSYQAGYQTTRNISFQYVTLGTFVEATDGTLYTSSTWASSGKTVNSIVLITDNCKLRIHPTFLDNNTLKPMGSNSGTDPASYIPAISESAARVDYNGYSNTQKWLQYNIATNTYNTNYGAPYATSTFFPDGIHKGYIPATGQVLLIRQNYSQLNTCFSAIGINVNFKYMGMQTSTYAGSNGSFYCIWFIPDDINSTGMSPISYEPSWYARYVFICADYE